MHIRKLAAAALLSLSLHFVSGESFTETNDVSFREIWAYLMSGEESFFREEYPITDLAYFSARISEKGELFALPLFSRLPKMGARRHLVVAETGNFALTHFVLSAEFGLRDKLVKDIALAAEPFDGVQIDFEAVPTHDREDFLDFLSLLKQEMPSKRLSVALPARTKFVDDAYDYARISAIVDRVVIMAYDEHWSGSKAGSIASLLWCAKVASYSSQAVPTDKLVMGLPFYGRAWSDKNPVGAYKYSSAQRIVNEKSATIARDAEGVPFFTFTETVNLIMYFEDAESLARRANIYRKAKVERIGFWRLGQEDPGIWTVLSILEENATP